MGASSVALSRNVGPAVATEGPGEQPAKELDGVRSSVRSGRPYGAEDWVEVISHRLGIVREPRRSWSWSSASRKDALTPEFLPPREKML